MICQNCKKKFSEKFFPDKCPYCNLPLHKKENPYDKNIYKSLKKVYQDKCNKYDVIEYGKQKYGLSTKECKRIVDFIAEEIYEDNHVLSQEQVAILNETKEFKFSFIEFFKHNLIYKLILCFLFAVGMKIGTLMTVHNFIQVLLIFGDLIAIIVLFGISAISWAKQSESLIIFDCGKIIYKQNVVYENKNYNDNPLYNTVHYYEYQINSIEKIREKRNHIIIKGNINFNYSINDAGNFIYDKNGLNKEVKIPKYYGHKAVELIYKYKEDAE